MAKNKNNDVARAGLFWPTFGLIVFLLCWLALCGTAFWYIYTGIVVKSAEPGVALTALQWMTWPFTVLAIAGPLLVLLSIGGLRVVRDLLDMQRLIGGLPDQVHMMQNALIEFRALRTQIITDVSRVNDATSDADEAEVQISESSQPEVEEFARLYERAKGFFYGALEDYNTSSAEPLIIQRGGSNFGEITNILRDKRAFAKSDDRNRRVANFVSAAFQLERSTRRSGRTNLTPGQVQALHELGSVV